MKTIGYGNKDAKTVLIQPAGKHEIASLEGGFAAACASAAEDIRMIACVIDDWNSELSPWSAPAVFGNESFGDGAAGTLAGILQLCEDTTKSYIIGGYSLAALFSLWAAYQTDRFAGVAAASPSMWFPGFTLYMKDNRIKCERVYLSLGDREEKTKNRVMATVGDEIRNAYDILCRQGIECVLEWNEGNHFKDAPKRTAKAFAWILERLNEAQKKEDSI
ncbi:MAG: esterase [Lachnospiraceae bacterium]|nr:esterase [Lachnospiraceae bacterium]